ncbi:hypothetical protein GCM10023201_23100 [Actinomycetospora corticicola]|uniref:Protein-S-isoprenylcysteine O-methyltransferase n=1 Tax=Actinomycetospora corticicola TaxID=663602 RepID=A0A7Y9J3T2_9PSEU|nr:protein-S-isoprenylcysteine O-methyltransferase [Actinomycetospora corticicola]
MRRTFADLLRAGLGAGGAFAGMWAMERLRPPVTSDDAGAPENQVGIGELTRAYFFSAGAIAVSPLLADGVRLPRWCGPVGIATQLGGFGLRVWAMRTLQGHYAHTLRVVPDQSVVRIGPYRYVRHPGYASVLLLWLGAAVSARNLLAPALTLVAVGTAYRHRMDAEDALLRRELPGYAEYAATTPRLLPRP